MTHIDAFIDAYMAEAVELPDLAPLAGMATSTFSRMSKGTHAISPHR